MLLTGTDSIASALQATLETGLEAIEEERYEAALEASHQLNDLIAQFSTEPRVHSRDQAAPYSILVVAHEKSDDHQALIDELLALDQARFELMFVENSADPLFNLDQSHAGRNIKVLSLGQNFGIGVARNIAILAAKGDGIISLDDDGFTDADNIEALIETFEAAEATAVRGRVVPKTPTSVEAPAHYSPGNRLVQRFCDIEGMTIWRRRDLLRVGSFDPLLFGHEGAELTARLYPLCGPDAFLYQPRAVLQHDFSQDETLRAIKLERYKKINGYIYHKTPLYSRTLGLLRKMPASPTASAMLEQRIAMVAGARPDPTGAPISIITTCYNGAEFIPEFVAALEAQTDQGFQLVFVDDGSDDDSLAILQDSLPDHMDLVHLRTERIGRSAALNAAVERADHDICMVADVDDLPVAQRVAWTRHAFADLYPDADMIGFLIYDQNSSVRASRPIPHKPIPLEVRSYFGMPAPFPAFAFRKSKMPLRFDTNLTAGVDCDWMFRSILQTGAKGYVIPVNATFYRLHDGQITSSKRELQRQTALGYLRQRHAELRDQDAVEDTENFERFVGWQDTKNGAGVWEVHEYAMSLAQNTHKAQVPDPQVLTDEILRHMDWLHLHRSRDDYNKLKKGHDVLRAEHQATKRQVRDLMTSTSWRLTAPVRFLRRLVSR